LSNPLDPQAILATLVYTGIGVVVFLAAFWMMARLAPFSLRKEIEEDQNVALGIVMGSVILGLAWIIGHAVG
jgi:uncharacterized membrane protein YjfL (UPF0719 family)